MLGYSYAGDEDKPLDIIVKFTTGSTVSSGSQNVFHQEQFANLEIASSVFKVYNFGTKTSTNLWPVTTNTTYYVKLHVFGTEKSYYISKDGENWRLMHTMTDTALSNGIWQKMFPRMYFGLSSWSCDNYFQGTIDFAGTKFIVDGVTVFDGATAVEGTDFGRVGYVYEVQPKEFMYFDYQNNLMIPCVDTSTADSVVIETKIMPRAYDVSNAGILDTPGDANGVNTQSSSNLSFRLSMTTAGTLHFRVSGDGTTGNYIVDITGTTPIPTYEYSKVRVTYSSSTGYLVEHSVDDGETWISDGTSEETSGIIYYPGSYMYFGNNSATSSSSNTWGFPGIVSLKDTKITVDGTVAFNGSTAVEGTDYKIITINTPLAVIEKTVWHQKDQVKTLTDSYYYNFYDNNSYLRLPTIFNPGTNTWEMVFKYYTGTGASSDNTIFGGSTSNDGYGILVKIKNSHICTYISPKDSSGWGIASGTSGSYTFVNSKLYWIKVVYDGSQYLFYYSLNGKDYTLDLTIANATPISATETYGSRCFGRAHASGEYPKNDGRIYLEDCYIKIGDDYYFNGKTAVEGTDFTVNGYLFKVNVYSWIKPAQTVDCYVTGAQNEWECEPEYQFTWDGESDYYELNGVEVVGEWRIASEDFETINYGGEEMWEVPAFDELYQLTQNGENLYSYSEGVLLNIKFYFNTGEVYIEEQQ